MTPGRGLFVYSPVLLLSIVGGILVWRRGPAAFRALSLGPPLVVLLVGKWFLWWGGHSWGPAAARRHDTRPLLSPVPARSIARAPATGEVRAGAVLGLGVRRRPRARGVRLRRPLGRADRSRRLLRAPLVVAPEPVWPSTAASLLRRLPLPSSPPASPPAPTAPSDLSASLSSTPVPQDLLAGERLPVLVAGEEPRPGAVAGQRRGRPRRRQARLALGRTRERGAGGPGAAARRRRPGILSGDRRPHRRAIETGRLRARRRSGQRARDVVRRARDGADSSRVVIGAPVRARSVPARRPRSASGAEGIDRHRSRIVSQGRSAEPGGLARVYPDRPRTFDAYLVLQKDRRRHVRLRWKAGIAGGTWPWRQWVKDLPLPGRATARFTVSLDELPAGDYRWYVVLTTRERTGRWSRPAATSRSIVRRGGAAQRPAARARAPPPPARRDRDRAAERSRAARALSDRRAVRASSPPERGPSAPDRSTGR